MRPRSDGLEDLRIGDLVTFLAVKRAGSITSAARELRVTPAQVSKAIARLEEHLRVKLLARSSRGVTLSEAGRKVVPNVESAVEKLRSMRRPEPPTGVELTVAAPSYLNTVFLPAIATSQQGLRVRGMDMPPALIRAYASENIFDMAVLPSGAERLPVSWSMERLGELRKSLFTTPAVARRLGALPVSVDALASVPFVCPMSNVEGKYVPIDDDCPLPIAERRMGHEAQTIGIALDLAARADQLVFGPVIAAHRHVAAGTLVLVPVLGWDVREPLQLACNGDRVLSRVQTAVTRALRAAMSELDATS
jgi:DNA-binding transcriptional LysR family regulator